MKIGLWLPMRSSMSSTRSRPGKSPSNDTTNASTPPIGPMWRLVDGRLRKQWHGKCAAAYSEFDRLAVVLKAESDQLDHDFGRIQREAASNHARKADLDELYAAAEQQMLYAAAERVRAEEQEVARRAEQELYERELGDLRDQLGIRLARLFIDVPVAADARAA